MRFFEKLVVAYFFGPPCIVQWTVAPLPTYLTYWYYDALYKSTTTIYDYLNALTIVSDDCYVNKALSTNGNL